MNESTHRTQPASATPSRARRWLIALIAWNTFDIALHVAVDQVEFVRVSSNLVVILVAAAAILKGSSMARALAAGVVVYVGLNAMFIARSGRIAPVMTILIIGTCALAYLSYRSLTHDATPNDTTTP